MQVLRSAGYRRMPWKNGGGVTTEIAVFPASAGLDDFGWRVSMATVAADGPFSAFPGIDRTLTLLEGQGLALEVEGLAPVVLTRGSAPFAFAADVATSARLLSGPIEDLNVMTRRGRFRHRVERRRLDGEGRIEAGGKTILLALGPLRVEAGGRPAELQRLDAACAEEPLLWRCERPCEALVIRIAGEGAATEGC